MHGFSSVPESEVGKNQCSGEKQSCKRAVIVSRGDDERSLGGCVINDLWEIARDNRIGNSVSECAPSGLFAHAFQMFGTRRRASLPNQIGAWHKRLSNLEREL